MQVQKILLFGKGGQVGWELQRSLAPLGEVVAVVFDSTDFCGDFTNLAGLAETVRLVKPSIIVNAAAHTAVDKAESEPDLARTINALAPGAIAAEAQKLGAWLVHYSTDYVFDGAGNQPYAPDDPTGPVGAYGRSKLAGEVGVRLAGGAHLILRTSWVISAHGNNFVKTMLRLGGARDSLDVVADQIGGPTPAAGIADALFVLAGAMRDGATGGTHHFAGAPDTSWADFARAIMAQAGLGCQIRDIASSQYPTPARRPLNSRLDCTSLRAYGIARPEWRQGLDDILTELGAKS